MSNGNAAAGLMMTVAVLTGMAHLHGSAGGHAAYERNPAYARRPWHARHWSSPERVELGRERIPVRSVRVRSPYGAGRRGAGETGLPPEYTVGYVDPDRGGPVVRRLRRVAEGDRMKVVRNDNSVAWYRVDSVRHSVGAEPQVPEVADRPELRLISVDDVRRRGGAPGDVVVSAHLDRAGETTE